MTSMKKLSTIAAACALTAAVGTVQAATDNTAILQQVQGTVMVNQGESYITAREGLPVAVGDELMILEQGSAILSYSDGCAFPITQDAVVTVQPVTASCADRQTASTQQVTTKYTQLGEEGGSALLWLLGGGAVVAAVIVANNNNDNTPSN